MRSHLSKRKAEKHLAWRELDFLFFFGRHVVFLSAELTQQRANSVIVQLPVPAWSKTKIQVVFKLLHQYLKSFLNLL